MTLSSFIVFLNNVSTSSNSLESDCTLTRAYFVLDASDDQWCGILSSLLIQGTPGSLLRVDTPRTDLEANGFNHHKVVMNKTDCRYGKAIYYVIIYLFHSPGPQLIKPGRDGCKYVPPKQPIISLNRWKVRPVALIAKKSATYRNNNKY